MHHLLPSPHSVPHPCVPRPRARRAAAFRGVSANIGEHWGRTHAHALRCQLWQLPGSQTVPSLLPHRWNCGRSRVQIAATVAGAARTSSPSMSGRFGGLGEQEPIQERRRSLRRQRRDPEQPELASAQPPTNSAGPVLRAGFTEVLVTGMLIEVDQRQAGRWRRREARRARAVGRAENDEQEDRRSAPLR